MSTIRSSTLMAVASALALGVVLPAMAQPEAPTPPAPPAPPAAPPAATAAPSDQPPAAPAAPVAPAAPADPNAPAAPPAPQAAAVEPPPPPPPPPPPTGDGLVVTNLLTKVCEPLIAGGNIDTLAKAAGMTKDRKLQKYVLPLQPKTPYQVVLENPGTNKNVCELTVQYALGWHQPILDGLNTWRFLHKPQMFLHRNEQGASVTGQNRTTTTWDNRANLGTDTALYGLVFVQQKNADGSPVNKYYDSAVVQYSIRKTDLPTG